MKRVALTSLGCGLLVALAGCVPGGGGKGGEAEGGPPPGGWPQPENGRLTEKMCGLLTDADYAKFGHKRLPNVSRKSAENGTNSVECTHMTLDQLTLDLQPTAAGAKLAFAQDLKDHKQRLASDGRPSILATGVVQGADESWFDYATLGGGGSEFQEHEIQVRRGALIVSIMLSGIRGKNEQNPRTVLAGLAGLVLSRIPEVGKTDTGTLPEIEFRVTGAGRARTISYHDPSSSSSVNLKNVKLPWHVKVPVVWRGQQVPLTLNATATASTTLGLAPIGCGISVSGRSLAEQRGAGFALCQGTYSESGQ